MSIRDGLIAVGIIILLVVLADLLRRFLKRNKLRLAIDEKFKDLPDIDLSSELPNGGARQVSANSDRSARLPDTSAKQTPVREKALNKSASAKVAPESPQEPESLGHSSPEAWVIDPILSGNRGPDEEVDLLLDLEFKGVGKGAGGWLQRGQKTTDKASEEDVDLLRSKALTWQENAAVAGETGRTDSESAGEAIDPASAPLGLVAEFDLIDLERPVHELLQARKQVDREGSKANSQTSSASESAPKTAEEAKVVEANVVEANVVEAKIVETKVPERRAAEKSAEPSAAQAEPPLAQKPELQPSFFDLDPDLAPDVKAPVAKPKSRRRRKKTEQQAAISTQERAPEAEIEDEVLIINVLAKQAPFSAPQLFKLVQACGLEFGEMEIFHRFEEAKGRGALQFSMANAVRPGTFDPVNLQPATTPAVSFFLRLADPTNRMNALECMLATAQCVADNLSGELKDENRSSLRTQTIEHYRQKVREFERKKLTRRN